MKKNCFVQRMLLLVFIITIPQPLLFAAADSTARINQGKQSTEAKLATILDAENKNQIISALSMIKPVFDANQDHMLTRIYYGRLLVKNGQTALAIKVLQPLVNETMQDWRPWFWLGTAQLADGDLENATYSLDEALAREGSVISIWVQRAIVEQERGKPNAAMHLLQVADSIEPNNSDVMINYAYASELSGDIEKATIIYKRFLQLSSSKSHYGSLRSQVLYRLSEFENAQKIIEEPEKSTEQEKS